MTRQAPWRPHDLLLPSRLFDELDRRTVLAQLELIRALNDLVLQKNDEGTKGSSIFGDLHLDFCQRLTYQAIGFQLVIRGIDSKRLNTKLHFKM